MTGPGRRGVDCRARYLPGPGAERPAQDAAAMVERVIRTAAPWATAISGFLGAEAAAPVLITLHDLPERLPFTKGRDIVLSADGWETSLAHELVHALAGRSPHPVANEGLAIYVDATLRLAGAVWPFFAMPPHRWVQSFREEGLFLALGELLTHSAPSFGREPRPEEWPAARRWYLHAGSFVGFLVERFGMASVWEGYRSGLLVPPGHDPVAIEAAWIAALGGELSQRERELACAPAA